MDLVGGRASVLAVLALDHSLELPHLVFPRLDGEAHKIVAVGESPPLFMEALPNRYAMTGEIQESPPHRG
jgi:hypothetical protein